MIDLHKHRYEYLEEVNEGILRHFRQNSTRNGISVLDVGCGSGALSEAIRARGYRVWGIEANRDAAARAAGRIDKVLCADLTTFPEVQAEIGQESFDYLVFSDVLEHVYDPFRVLKQYLGLLKENGHVLISVPNAVVWTNRIKVLFGRFDYSDTGVMDRTHIRFFTFRTAKQLVESAGCSIVKTDYTPYFVRAALPTIKRIFLRGQAVAETDRRQLIDSPLYQRYLRSVYPVEYALGRLCKPLFAFRIVIVGKKS